VVPRVEHAEERTKRGEPAVRRIREVVDAARRRVRHEHVEEATAPQAIHDEGREHAQDREPHLPFAPLERTLVVAARAFEAAAEDEIDRPGALVERGGDGLVFDVADGEDAHASSVRRGRWSVLVVSSLVLVVVVSVVAMTVAVAGPAEVAVQRVPRDVLSETD